MENKTATKARKAGTAKKTSTRKAGTAAVATAKRTPAKKNDPAKPAAKRGQQANAGAKQHQGGGTMTGQQAPMFGGTKQVAIEEVAMSSRGGRKQGPEQFPFGDLTPSRIDAGTIIGPSFFVANSDNPKKVIAAGRKRHKPDNKVFLTRQMEGPAPGNPEQKVPGVRVWLAPPGHSG